MDSQPLLPDADVPVLIWMTPDTPFDVTSAVANTTDPDPELTLAPLVSKTEPPTLLVPPAAPPLTRTLPDVIESADDAAP